MLLINSQAYQLFWKGDSLYSELVLGFDSHGIVVGVVEETISFDYITWITKPHKSYEIAKEFLEKEIKTSLRSITIGD